MAKRARFKVKATERLAVQLHCNGRLYEAIVTLKPGRVYDVKYTEGVRITRVPAVDIAKP